MSTVGCGVSSSAPAVPPSTTTLSTPAGRPAASAAMAKSNDEIGVSGLGRRITELPAINAGTSFWNAMMIAPLYGVIAATTPTGSCLRMLRATRPRRAGRQGPDWIPRASSTGRGRSSERASPTPALSWVISANRVGWPASATRVGTSVSAQPSMKSTNSCSTRARSAAASSAHVPWSKLRRASAMARSTSACGVTVTSWTWVSSAGFSTATTSSPVTHVPPTNVRRSARIVTHSHLSVVYRRNSRT